MFQKKFPWGKVAVAFVIGAAAGAAAALLLAPKTGKELQKQLRDQAGNVEKVVKKMVA